MVRPPQNRITINGNTRIKEILNVIFNKFFFSLFLGIPFGRWKSQRIATRLQNYGKCIAWNVWVTDIIFLFKTLGIYLHWTLFIMLRKSCRESEKEWKKTSCNINDFRLCVVVRRHRHRNSILARKKMRFSSAPITQLRVVWAHEVKTETKTRKKT